MKKSREMKLMQELLETQRKLIAELEKRPAYSQTIGFGPAPIYIPSVWQVRCNPGPCAYDPIGTSALMRHCKICGQPEIITTITATSGVITTTSASIDETTVTRAEVPKTNSFFVAPLGTISRS